ncbi:ornithine carbamoyltransferase, partial [Streptococcus pyogenes]
EHFGKLEGLHLVYAGDGRNNVANSLLVTAAILGVDITILSPESLQPEQAVIDLAHEHNTGSKIKITSDTAAVKGADA